jgi:hypothetical protein
MNLKENYSEKLVKFVNFSTKMVNLKIQFPFCPKKYSTRKLISRHNEQSNTLTRQEEYKGKIYVKNIGKNFCVGSETN